MEAWVLESRWELVMWKWVSMCVCVCARARACVCVCGGGGGGCMCMSVRGWVGVRAFRLFFFFNFVYTLPVYMRESARTCRDCYFEVFAVLAVKLKCSTVSVILPFLFFFAVCTDPGTQCPPRSTPALIKVPKQVDCDMCGLSKILLFSVLYGWQCSTDETGLLLLYIIIFFALCLLLLTWSIAGVACSACHSSGTFFFSLWNTHTRARTRAHTACPNEKI